MIFPPISLSLFAFPPCPRFLAPALSVQRVYNVCFHCVGFGGLKAKNKKALKLVEKNEKGGGVVSRGEFTAQMLAVLRVGGAEPAEDVAGVWATIDPEESEQASKEDVGNAVKNGLFAFVPGWDGDKAAKVQDAVENGADTVAKAEFLESVAKIISGVAASSEDEDETEAEEEEVS